MNLLSTHHVTQYIDDIGIEFQRHICVVRHLEVVRDVEAQQAPVEVTKGRIINRQPAIVVSTKIAQPNHLRPAV